MRLRLDTKPWFSELHPALCKRGISNRIAVASAKLLG